MRRGRGRGGKEKEKVNGGVCAKEQIEDQRR